MRVKPVLVDDVVAATDDVKGRGLLQSLRFIQHYVRIVTKEIVV